MWPGSIWAASAALLCGLAVNAEARPPEAPKLTAEEARARNLPPIAYKYKADPDAYHGSIREASQLVRVALTGSTRSPDMHAIAKALGPDEVLARLRVLA